jgi:hypothetical protein
MTSTPIGPIGEERLREMIGMNMPCVPASPGDVARLVRELLWHRQSTAASGLDGLLDELERGCVEDANSPGRYFVEDASDKMAEAAIAIRQLLSRRAQGGEGWRVVPDELTGDMWAAARKVFDFEAERFRVANTTAMAMAIADRAPEKIYAAMLATAPSVPAVEPMAELRNAAQAVYDKLASETGTVTIFDQEALGKPLASLPERTS